MARTRTSRLTSLITAALIAASLLAPGSIQSQPAQSQPASRPPSNDGLKIINNPGGGQVVYGSLTGQSSLPSAMGFMLRTVHSHFGDRPRIGKFFQANGADSAATFFNLNVSTQGGKPIAGLVIVTMPRGGAQPSAAILYDDAARFPRTEPAMMKALNQAWQNEAGQYASSQPAAESGSGTAQASTSGTAQASTPAHTGTPQTLRQVTGGDRSASIGLPSGWNLTSVSGGQLIAAGPNGEMLGLGIIFQQIHDPRSMQSQRTPYAGAAAGGTRPLVAPLGGDLFSSYVSVTNQVRQNRGLPPATFQLTSSKSLPGGDHAIQAIFVVDLHDGKGPRKGSARVGVIVTPGLPTWAMTVSASNAPEAVADAEAPAMLAMIHSYSQDAAVIGRENQVVLNNIAAVGRASAQQAADADARRIASSKSFNQHMDDIDRSSKAFQNYQFDSSQLQDNDINARGTVDNRTADALVKADPNRFQIITRPDFIKGVDY
jgi:hypothetical protein